MSTSDTMKAYSYDFVEGNSSVLELMKAAPDKILGYCGVNPRFGEFALREIDRCVIREGMMGVELFPSFPNWLADEPCVFPMMELLSKLRVPILINADPVQPLFNLADHFPDAIILNAWEPEEEAVSKMEETHRRGIPLARFWPKKRD